ncbi:MAG TPA: type 1 glutamine amidotransferase [Terriglobia bacterium]|nr:type 1 glutamine amidotransferase [Terriglobia bacterium]
MQVHIIQHVAFEGPGAIGRWARERGHALATTEQWTGSELPGIDEFDFLVIMGGPMSANDEAEFAWLAPEKELIAESLRAEKPILGVCLGAQLLANVLGARVYRNPEKEIGWFPVSLTPEAQASVLRDLPETLTVLHWHGETFDLPEGAARLAESAACRNQAFEFRGRALGLQFHLEVEPEGLGKLIENCAGDIDSGTFVQSAEEMLASAAASEALRPALYGILDRLAAAAQHE